MAPDSPSLLNKDPQQSDIWWHGDTLPGHLVVLWQTATQAAIWGGLAAQLWEVGSAGSLQLLAPSGSAEWQRAATPKVMPFLVQQAPGWGRGAKSWYPLRGSAHCRAPCPVDGIFVGPSQLDFLVPGTTSSNSLHRYWLLKNHLATPSSTLASLLGDPYLLWGTKPPLVVWEGRASALAMNLAKGCTKGGGDGGVYHIKCLLLRKAWLTEVRRHLNI